jgi:hypothetical protein
MASGATPRAPGEGAVMMHLATTNKIVEEHVRRALDPERGPAVATDIRISDFDGACYRHAC